MDAVDGEKAYLKHQCGHGVRHVPWRRAWQPTPAFLPGESRQGLGLDCSPPGFSVHGLAKSWTQLSDSAQHSTGAQ